MNLKSNVNQFDAERGFVVFGKMFFEGQNDAVGYDGQQNHVLERRVTTTKQSDLFFCESNLYLKVFDLLVKSTVGVVQLVQLMVFIAALTIIGLKKNYDALVKDFHNKF